MIESRAVEERGEVLLDIQELQTHFITDAGRARRGRGDLTVHRGETLGIVGESGCGKSVTALSVMRLIPYPPGESSAGEILLRGAEPAGAVRR